MASLVYLLCTATCLAVALLLARQYRRRRTRLLFWAALCFVGLTANNVLLFADLVLYPSVNLATWRGLTAAVAVGVLLYGLIWDPR